MDPNSGLLMWSLKMTNQVERSRSAEQQHIRAEQVRQARGTRPTLASSVWRALRAFASTTRASADPTAVATQP